MTLSLARLPSSSLVVAALLSLGACTTPVVIASGTGGSTTSTSSSSTGSTSSSSGTGGGNACALAGGTCEAVTPGFCLQGTVGDTTQYPCGTGVGTACCLPKGCIDTCTTPGATRCSGGAMETCQQSGSCVSWIATAECPTGEGCNSDGTKCVAPVTQCASPADCGCGCTCTPQGTCGFCTGAIPPSCAKDGDCGADCAGLRCVSSKCQVAPCIPGQDQTCNESLAMQSFAGTCNADRTCTCKAGFSLKADGRCG